jgi:hypothetical protein
MIPDPRQYTEDYPKTNIIIDTALQIQNGGLILAQLDDVIANNLRNENDALINVALNLSPSNQIARLIWDGLNRVINSVPDNDIKANIFAIPLILVAGSKNKARLKSQIDTDKLNLFFSQNGIFKSGSDCFISGKLIDPNKLGSIRQSQLYYWVRNLAQSRLWLPIQMEGSSIDTLNEGVFLRFLIGVSIDKNDFSGLDVSACSNQLMGLMQLINEELKTDGVTLFPIPFAPVPLSSAFATGVEYRTEIAISVAISNIVRKMREQQLTPHALISSEGEALKIVVKTREESDLSETSLWSLSRFASYAATLQQLCNLLHDMGIEYATALD